MGILRHYDTLGNLLTVNQGSQTRTFVYDSLKRLSSATNPESGAVNYTYDGNGNLLTKTDARSIVTTMIYDQLNRVKSKSYSDGTPAVSYFYDNQTWPGFAPAGFTAGTSYGRLTAVTLNGSNLGSFSHYDLRGRVTIRYQVLWKPLRSDECEL